jgi:hypothetical protein
MAALGYRVVQTPVGSKHPFMIGWPDKATPDHKTIEARDSRWSGMNWSLATDKEIFVVDCDGDQGNESLIALEKMLCLLPRNTWRVGTPRGVHILLKPPAGTEEILRNQQPLKVYGVRYPGLDIRGYHGQILLPGSLDLKSGKRRAWAPGCSPVETSLQECPAEWWAVLPKKEFGPATSTRSRTSGRTGERRPSVPHDPYSYVIGDDGGGFNAPIWKLCLRFFRMFGADADASEFKEALRFAIMNANAEHHTTDQVERYASDAYLDAELTSARNKITNAD